MLRKRFFSILLILGVLLSTAGIMLSTTQPAAAAPSAFSKIYPPNDPEGNDPILTSVVTLQWEAAAGAVRYEYCIFTKLACPPGQFKQATSGTSITVTLKPSTIYYWHVRALAADGMYTYANDNTGWKFKTGTAAPQNFNKLTPSNGATNQPINLTLTWETSPGLNVNYQVCYDKTSNNQCDNNVWLMAGTATSYTLNGLDYDTPYSWQVRAYNSKGTVYANTGTWWSFRTRIAPPRPFVKLAPNDTATAMPLNTNLVWSPSAGTALTYQYCIDETNNNICDTTWTSSGTNAFAAPPSLAYNRTYYWQVRALNNSDPNDSVEANDGTWWSFNTLLDPPTGFTKVQPAEGATDVSLNPYLYWSTSEGTGITYEYCLVQSSQTCNNWTSAGTNTYVRISTALLNNTAYTWQVRARDAASNYTYADGAQSAVRQFTTLPAAPTWIPPASDFSTPEDPTSPYTAQLNATNPAGKTLTYTLTGRAPAGTFSLAANGLITYIPELNFNGSVTFSFTIWDGVNNPSGPYTATINVTAVNDPPVILPIQDVSVFSGSDIFFTIEASDPDLTYGDSLQLSVIGTLPVGATLTPAQTSEAGVISIDFEWFGAQWIVSHTDPYAFTAVATDSQDERTEDPFTVTITSYTARVPLLRR